MTSQPVEQRVQVLEDDLTATKRILREIAERQDREAERSAVRTAAIDERIDRNAEQIAALTQRMDRTNERLDSLIEEMHGIPRQLELLTVAVQSIHGPIDRDYEPGPSGRSDDPPGK